MFSIIFLLFFFFFSTEEMMEIAKSVGFQGTELVDFIKETKEKKEFYRESGDDLIKMYEEILESSKKKLKDFFGETE